MTLFADFFKNQSKYMAVKNLVIVESPAKAKTIEGFLGEDFIVKSSFGHIRDLAKNDKAIDIANNFQPNYEVSEDKQKIVTELKKLTKQAEMVWLATDEDREGEAISWHLFEALGLKAEKTKRIVFHEITKNAILNAIKNYRQIDKNLVDAQQARRILDRLVGFELSPILWKKVKPSLSAGRVQSVAVRLIVDRERDVSSFVTNSAFKISGNFISESDKKSQIFKAELSNRMKTKEEAEKFLKSLFGATYVVKDIETKPSKKSPAAPFTTSTLQQEASRKLGYSVAQTMVLAQKLYESGKITYMRTDSVNLSETALQAAKEEITHSFGKEYVHTRQFKTKSASAQEAHEAIRPSYMEKSTIDGDSGEKRLYDLIWKRTIASQMSDALLEKTVATIKNSKTSDDLIARGEVLKFDGFLKVYMESTDDEDDETKDGMLPKMTIGENVSLQEMTATQRFAHAAARYTEASLVKKLEELGIGRPSTYAPTISTVQKRGYVVKEDREGKERAYDVITLKNDNLLFETKTENTGAEKSKLFPTDIGSVVNDFLVENFKNILDFNFTAKVEKEFDEIANGEKVWNDMIKSFYVPFHQNVEETEKTSERATGEKYLGEHEGKKVIVRIGRFGPMVQMGATEGEEKPAYVSLRAGQRIENITFEEAMDLFKLPRNIGQFEDEDITIAIGRFGPYAKHKGAFYSLKKTDDPMIIVLDRAIEIILEKRKAESEKHIKSFEGTDIQVLNGRWGPYISAGEKNVKIPKDKDPHSLTLEECNQLIKDFKPSAKSKFKKSFAKKS